MDSKKGLFVAALFMFGLSGIANATPPADKEVMVAISSAYVPDAVTVNDEAFVIGSGMFPNSCYKWSRAELKDVTQFDHVIRSYAWVDQSGPCLMYMVPFNQEVKLGKLAAGVHRIRFLSHDDTFLEKQLVVR